MQAPGVASQTPPSPRTPCVDQRDRFLTFAFAAADLLIETGPHASITFAAGAFRLHQLAGVELQPAVERGLLADLRRAPDRGAAARGEVGEAGEQALRPVGVE